MTAAHRREARRPVAEWGGHPFLYEIDVMEQGGSGSLTYAPDQGNVGTDVRLCGDRGEPVEARAPEHRGRGSGITPMTAVISWP